MVSTATTTTTSSEALIKRFDGILRENYNKTLPEFSEIVLTELAQHFQVSRGAFFVFNRKKERMQVTAGYACSIGRMEITRFKSGEGLLGECVARKEMIYLENLPKKIIINTSLSELQSVSILMLPLVFNDEVGGLIEFVSPKKFLESDLNILEEISRNIASVLVNFLSNLENRQLIERLKNQTQKLHDKELQLRKNIEKLEATQEEMKAKQDQLEEANAQIEQQKAQLEDTFVSLQHKNIQVTDSIRYAQTIQQSILPFGEKLDEFFEEHFVIYRPKDIVSGDFFWVSHMEGKTFIASVDCTGHGVPGAFMSLIGYSQLNAVVNEKRIYEPATILEVLHFKIQKILRQENLEKRTDTKDRINTDGMDICFCAVEHIENQKVIVKFAGAKLPLYMVRSGTDKLESIRGDRRSIGGFIKKNVGFTNKEFEVSTGTTLYLTTDGFIDQSNPERKRIGSAALKSELQKICKLPLKAQKEALETLLIAHQQDEEQRDDITLIGVRV